MKKNIITSEVLSQVVNIKKLSKEFYTFASPLLVFNTIAIVFTLLDIWLLQRLSGSEQVGFYGLAYAIAAMCFLFTSAMTPIITREFAKNFEENNLEEIKKLFLKYIPMLYSIAAYFAIFISFQSENLLYLFTDEKFIDAYLVLVVLAFYPIHQTYGQLSGSIFYVTDQTKLVRNIGIFASLIGFILTIIFIYYLELNAVGLAWKMVLIQILSVNLQLYFNCKFLNLKLSTFMYHQFFSVLFFVLVAYITSFMILELENKLIEFLLSGTVYTVFVIIGILLFPSIVGMKRSEMYIFKRTK